MPQLCTHPSRSTYHEPDGSPEGGYWIVTICAVCMVELGRVHVIG
jgi:hypothetical protein